MPFLPREVVAKAPPIKMQGIKTRLVALIARSIHWDGDGRWIEPFFGSGTVALNLRPKRALLADTNVHLIRFYRAIQQGSITADTARRHLEREGALLADKGESHYYAVRERFNERGDPLDFLFLNRSCFNGLLRFNRKGAFNVAFCRKPERFRPTLITRIANQIDWAREAMAHSDWQFAAQDWRITCASAASEDMIYADPPYVGRHTDYYNAFTRADADDLAQALLRSRAGFVLSMWLENKHRRNDYVDRWFSSLPRQTTSHFYHLGSYERFRNPMTEALIISHPAALPNQADAWPGREPPTYNSRQAQAPGAPS